MVDTPRDWRVTALEPRAAAPNVALPSEGGGRVEAPSPFLWLGAVALAVGFCLIVATLMPAMPLAAAGPLRYPARTKPTRRLSDHRSIR